MEDKYNRQKQRKIVEDARAVNSTICPSYCSNGGKSKCLRELK